MSDDMRIAPHFLLSEFTTSTTAAQLGIDNHPIPEILENIMVLANTLEKVRKVLGHPIVITSGYRCPPLNKAVGGVDTSMHMQGCAADFICPGYGSPLQICKTLEPHMQEFGIDQLIHEFGSWVHLGIVNLHNHTDPRHMALTIDARGTRIGFA